LRHPILTRDRHIYLSPRSRRGSVACCTRKRIATNLRRERAVAGERAEQRRAPGAVEMDVAHQDLVAFTTRT
jgi:hypothetical protein